MTCAEADPTLRDASFQPSAAEPRGAKSPRTTANQPRGAGFKPASPTDHLSVAKSPHAIANQPCGAGFEPASAADERSGAKSPRTTANQPRGAGFKPASPFGLRRPFHVDLGPVPYFVTTRTHAHRRVFVGTAAGTAIAELTRQRDQYGFLLLSFVFMPDHAHFVIVPADGFTIVQTMRAVKGSIARRVNATHGGNGPVWQDGFRDDAPKTLDELHAYITYVEQNPVRAGLANEPASYAYSSAGGRCEADYQAFFALEREVAG